jgi:hypothetical protein
MKSQLFTSHLVPPYFQTHKSEYLQFRVLVDFCTILNSHNKEDFRSGWPPSLFSGARISGSDYTLSERLSSARTQVTLPTH